MSRIYLGMLVVFAALTGCTVTPDQAAIGPYPTNYEQLVKEQVRQSFFDPYSIRDSRLSAPQQGHMFMQQGWIVCLEANAKNRMGGYTGLKRTAYLINGERIVNSWTDAPFCNSPQVNYQPLALGS
jgi:hypothetical protein